MASTVIFRTPASSSTTKMIVSAVPFGRAKRRRVEKISAAQNRPASGLTQNENPFCLCAAFAHTCPELVMTMAPRPSARTPRHLAAVTTLFVNGDLRAVLSPAGVKDAFLVEPTVGVGAEIIAQALQEVSRAAAAPQAVVIGE